MSSATADAAVHQYLADWLRYVRVQWLQPDVFIIILPTQRRDLLGGERCMIVPHNLLRPFFFATIIFKKDNL